MPYTPKIRYGGELRHYRTKGSRNGIRRYQNLDGSLTAAGYARYNVDPNYQQKLEQQKRMTEQKLKQQQAQAQAQAQAQRNQPQRFQRPTQQAPKPYVSKEYQRNLAYNSQQNNFSGNSKPASKPAAQRTPTTANRNSSNMAPKPYKPTSSVGGGGSPYVSEEYQRNLAYNSQQNNFPNQNGNQEEDKDKGKKKAPKKANISEPQAEQPQSNEGKKKGGIGSWFSDRVKDARRAADSVGDAARGVASNVGRAASNAANRAGEAARNAGGNAGNWLTDRIGDVKKAADRAGDTVRNTANQVGDNVRNAANRAGEAARNAGGNAGNWLTDRIGDVKKAVSGATNNVSKAASNAAKKAKETANQVGDSVRNAANRAGDTVRNTANQVGDNVRNAAGKAKKAASDVSDWATKGRQYQAEAEKYEKKLKDDTDDERYLAKLQREGDARVNQNALNKKAADSAKAAKSASQKASDYVRSWGNNRITANDSKSLGREDSQRIGSIANKLAGDAAKANTQAKKDKKERDYWANLNRQGDEEYGNRAKAYAGRAATARQKYNNSLAGQVDEAKTTASNAANRVKDAYSNSILGKSDKAIIEGVRNAGRNVGRAASNAANQIQTTAAESKRRAEQFIENFFGGNKKKKKKK